MKTKEKGLKSGREKDQGEEEVGTCKGRVWSKPQNPFLRTANMIEPLRKCSVECLVGHDLQALPCSLQQHTNIWATAWPSKESSVSQCRE